MNYEAFTNDNLTMMYKGVRGTMTSDDALKGTGKTLGFASGKRQIGSSMPPACELSKELRPTASYAIHRAERRRKWQLDMQSSNLGTAVCVVDPATGSQIKALKNQVAAIDERLNRIATARW